MFKKIFSWIISSALLLLLLSFSSQGALAVGSNGSFETGNYVANGPGFETLSSPNSDITDWTVDLGSVDWINTYWPASNGSYSVDLNGLTTGSISQTLTTVVGATYDVSFDLSGNPDSRSDTNDPYYSLSNKIVRVTATGSSSNDYNFDTSVEGNSLSDMKWKKNNTYSFVATTTSTTLTFASQTSGAFGPVVDNVAIAETLPVVAASCPGGTTQNFLETKAVDSGSSSSTSSINSLVNGGTYLLVASGDWANRNDSNQRNDAEYVTLNNWSTYENGYDHADYHLGEGEFDLQVDGAFVDWGSYNSGHSYSRLYTGTGSPANFLIFDGDSTTNTQHPEWYGDNSGSLSVDIYSCDPTVTSGTISGMKYNDKNRNGHKDSGEEGLQGWTIRLLRDNPNGSDTFVTSVVTDADGNYTFTDVAPGTYDVRETHQKGWKRYSKNPKDIVIEAGDNITGVDFGNAQKRREEKEDTDKDDNRDEQQGEYHSHNHRGNYEKDKDSKEHQQNFFSNFGNFFHR